MQKRSVPALNAQIVSWVVGTCMLELLKIIYRRSKLHNNHFNVLKTCLLLFLNLNNNIYFLDFCGESKEGDHLLYIFGELTHDLRNSQLY